MIDASVPTSPGNRGGRRAAIGFDFQARVGAWLAAQMLAGVASSSLHLVEHSVIDGVAFETGDAIDDIRVDIRSPSSRLRIWIQAKRNITISERRTGDLAKAIAQCLAAFDEQGSVESLFYIVCSAESRRATQRLERARVALNETAVSQDAQRARGVLASLGAHEALLAKLRFIALDVEDGGSDYQRAQDLLAMRVLPPGESARAAWSALVTECLRRIRPTVTI